jgi:hypothetical protein
MNDPWMAEIIKNPIKLEKLIKKRVFASSNIAVPI